MIVCPLLFVDIDGVLNCPAHPLGPPTHQLGWTRPAMGEHVGLVEVPGEPGTLGFGVVPASGPLHMDQPVWVPDGALDRLRRLTRSFDCVWATSWRLSAPAAWGPVLGVGDDWPVLDYDRRKLAPMLAFAGQRPWAFVDDDIPMELRDLGRPLPVQPAHLLVDTDETVGLTDEHVQRLEAFAASCGQPQRSAA